MISKSFLKKLLFLVAVISLIYGGVFSCAFAQRGHGGRGGGHGGWHEPVWHGNHRYDYYNGLFYTSGLFGFSFSVVAPPLGVAVSYLPYGYRTIYVGGVPYYEYNNIYYRPYGTRYVVVERPVLVESPPEVVYVPAASTPVPPEAQTGSRETVIINVPRDNGGYVAITLARYTNGFVGPQGEFYPTLPTGEQLRARYGR